MSELLATACGAALLALLAFLVFRSILGASGANDPTAGWQQDDCFPACPTEFVERIFSDEDRDYIAGLKSAQLTQQFNQERTALALLWVTETAAGIHRILREHRESARRSPDLHSITEIRLGLQYCGLMLICGTLLVLIRLAGPFWLRSLASYAHRLSEEIAEGRRALRAAMTPPTAGAQSS